MKVLAPGKLILSGEHAVLYGCPAIALAVNRYVTVTLSDDKKPRIQMILSDLAHQSQFSLATLKALKHRIKRKYHRFIAGDYTIRDVLKKPFELAQYALGACLEALNQPLPEGMILDVQSTIPLGCGMGSSAATIMCVMYALSCRMEKQLSPEQLFNLALDAENMQHGYSSGLDLHMAQHGGCVYSHEKQFQPRAVPAFPLYLVNTGQPMSTTGECVQAASVFFQDKAMQKAFTEVTHAMDQALITRDHLAICGAIKENHRLLSAVGVVPKKVSDFIARIEASQGAAKICGAGAVSGETAGMVWVMCEDKVALTHICEQYAYTFFEIQGETQGVHVV